MATEEIELDEEANWLMNLLKTSVDERDEYEAWCIRLASALFRAKTRPWTEVEGDLKAWETFVEESK